VSVFVERRVPSDGVRRQAPAAGAARLGSSSTFSTVIDDHKITAVGEVPPRTVESIATSLKADRLTLQPPRR
jgi:sigma-E factor negative regulatory protein RseB